MNEDGAGEVKNMPVASGSEDEEKMKEAKTELNDRDGKKKKKKKKKKNQQQGEDDDENGSSTKKKKKKKKKSKATVSSDEEGNNTSITAPAAPVYNSSGEEDNTDKLEVVQHTEEEPLTFTPTEEEAELRFTDSGDEGSHKTLTREQPSTRSDARVMNDDDSSTDGELCVDED